MTAPVLFSKEHVATLKMGDQFETDGVLPGVSDHKTVWKVTLITGSDLNLFYFLEARYRGVYFGTFTYNKGKLVQEKRP